jgi:hypothetical protein
MFPIYLKEQDPFSPPPEPTYFLVAQEGVFLVKRSPLYESVTPYSGALPGLASQWPQLRVHLPKLPQRLLERVVGFFLEVFRRYGTEAVVVLLYAPQRGFRIGVPRQSVRRWYTGVTYVGTYHVQYEHYPRPPGYLQLGTMHSHGDLPASHSCIDEDDERYQEGLHITVGDILAPQPSFRAVFVANGHRFALAPEDVLAGYNRPYLPAPPGWLANVQCRTYSPYRWLPSRNGQQWSIHEDTAATDGPAEADGA